MRGYQSRASAVVAAIWLFSMPASIEAQTPPAAGTAPQTVVLSGDSWQQGEKVFRLYGVQSCLRGSVYMDQTGERKDCGAVAAAMLAAFLRDTRPRCRSVAQIRTASTSPTVLVACSASIATQELDLGSMMIGQGFAFAALTDLGQPVYASYLAQEILAQEAQKGLWAFEGFQRPDFRKLGLK
ncbi:hypothetical protein BJF92_09120 [Rhizobium rhizosphaerae]|uniref:Uncharacterized protein n=1 Tax=Xaviernesmea rhizosphaerae TaxID=1672749 RepID=A0A1Q9AKI9_9HYPH|nr:hypothetical protein [Xaviernesmea rhizosphaerae]OLP55784.1 hypothetical protein BJF92_09120 [Xaviernesmea rhizosphaerae]